MGRKAVLIGINYTGTSAQLKGCHNDVKQLKEFLLAHEYPADSMRILIDDGGSSLPTRQNIMDSIKWLVAGAKSGDILFLHYSGHGGQTKDTSGDEDDGIDEVLYPVDYQTAGFIVDDEVHDLISSVPPGVHVNAILDCCHSGSGLDLPFTYKSKEKKMTVDEKENKKQKNKDKKAKKKGKKDKKRDIEGDKKEKKDKKEDKKEDKKDKKDKKEKKPKKEKKDKKDKGRGFGDTIKGDIVLISGCMDTQTSSDTSVAGQATGALTHSLVHVLTTSKGAITYEDLLINTRQKINEISRLGQIPQLSYHNPEFDVDTKIIL
eukprot:TRINITY_DN6374_c0_g1_i1.p1 TRINITY_DN6374_c0_g1~~TRINITY_DN6374_c0_g1_i1.p1  ORF type:complete len:319 (-),score=103.64 TRINITY_DN6374_c0_g1_i1:33-989(-)